MAAEGRVLLWRMHKVLLKLATTCTVGVILYDLETACRADRFVQNCNNSHKQDINSIMLIHCCCWVFSCAEAVFYFFIFIFLAEPCTDISPVYILTILWSE